MLLSWKGQHFFLTEMNTSSEYRFAFPARSAFVKASIHVLIECVIHHVMVFHTTLLPSRNTTWKCFSGPMLMVLTGFTIFFSFLRQLAWGNCGMAFWRQSYIVSWAAMPVGLGQGSPEDHICSESVSNICCCFSHSQEFWGQESRDGNVNCITQYYG